MMDLKKERVLVTGGSGFLGRHVCERLADMGVEFWAPSHDECDFSGNLAGVVFMRYRPTCVIHLAAFCGGINANRMNPARMITQNLEMAINVIDNCLLYHSKVVLIGSVCSYPKHCPIPFRESHLWNGYPDESNAPYGIAKRTMFEIARAYHEQHGLKVACLLPANLYGPGDNFNLETSHVIPAMIRRFVEAKEDGADCVTLWGTGKPTREFLYVEDCADAIIKATELIEDPSPINIGTGREIAIANLAKGIAEFVGYTGDIAWNFSKPDGQPRRCLDTNLARELLGWEAKTALPDGIRQTVDWYMSQKAVAV